MGNRNKPRVLGPIAPPLETFAAAITRITGETIVSLKAELPDPEKSLRAFAGFEPIDLAKRPIGDWVQLGAVYDNALIANHAMRDLAGKVVAIGGVLNQRANDAGVNLITAYNMVSCAVLLHMRRETWNDRCALSLVRTALECAGRAALIATGAKDEPHRWDKGPAFSSTECLGALARLLPSSVPGGATPKAVFDWLCNFTHMNNAGLEHFTTDPGDRHEDTFAALAYVSWTVAIVTEVISGKPGLARWPASMPAKLPW